MAQDLSGKVAVVTGGSRGIGQAIVIELVSAGATVVIAGVSDSSRTQTLARQSFSGQNEIFAVPTNVTSPKDIENLVGQVTARYGNIHILVNNAGITSDSLLVRMREESWDAVITTNLKSVFLTTRAVLPIMMKERWGRIINITSVVGLIGNAGQANYTASKAGLIGMTKTVAREVASRGITVNAVAPGFIETELTAPLKDKIKDQIMQQIPQRSFGSPKDVAYAVHFLASPRASYITGQVLNVDGGMVMS